MFLKLLFQIIGPNSKLGSMVFPNLNCKFPILMPMPSPIPRGYPEHWTMVPIPSSRPTAAPHIETHNILSMSFIPSNLRPSGK